MPTSLFDCCHIRRAPGEVRAGALIAILATVCGVGCGSASEPATSNSQDSAFESCGIRVTGSPSVEDETLPADLSSRAVFASMDYACRDGGWDLQRCAGGPISLTTWATEKTGDVGRVMAVSVRQGEALCCVYQYQELPQSGYGGSTMIAAPCGPAYRAVSAMKECSIIANPTRRRPSVEEVTLPLSLAGDALWGPRGAICDQGGYDLSGCLGKKATLTTVLESHGLAANPAPFSAWILTEGDTVCCIWETDGADAPSLLPKRCPGLSPLPEGQSDARPAIESTVAPPLPTGDIAQPVAWSTDTVSLSADDLRIILDGKTYGADFRSLRVSSDPGGLNYTTLEATWYEHDVEMRLNMYFRSDGVNWWSDEIRTYDGNSTGAWLFYKGMFFTRPVGTPFRGGLVLQNNGASDGAKAVVTFRNLNLLPTFVCRPITGDVCQG